MSDKIQLIKQEIERLKHTSNAYDRSRFMLLLEIEKFIESLQEEPTDETIKENYHERYKRIAQTEQFKKTYCDKSLGKEEPASEDWEREYDNYFKEHEMDIVLNPYSNCKDIARHFAEWQKNQMMKDVFIVDYIVHDGRIELEGDPLPSVDPIILLPYPKFKPNDKVKIIIVKEE